MQIQIDATDRHRPCYIYTIDLFLMLCVLKMSCCLFFNSYMCLSVRIHLNFNSILALYGIIGLTWKIYFKRTKFLVVRCRHFPYINHTYINNIIMYISLYKFINQAIISGLSYILENNLRHKF